MVTQVASDDITETERQSATFVERLICVDPKLDGDHESNKFWHGYALADGSYFAEWGKVGVTRQINRLQPHEIKEGDAQTKIEKETKKRFNYKPPKKVPYVRQQTIATDGTSVKTANKSKGKAVNSSDLRERAIKEIATDPIVRKLVGFLDDVNIHSITANTNIVYDTSSNTFSTALGLVTASGIADARQLLVTLGDLAANRKQNTNPFKRALVDYMQIIPQSVGMKSVTTLIPDVAAVQKQGQILDALDAALITATKPKKKTKKAPVDAPKLFDVKLTPVNVDKVINRIKKKFSDTRKDMHHDVRGYKVKTVYAVEIGGMASSFLNDGAKLNPIWELWHGTKASNLLSILKVGMIIPPSSSGHVTGRMYGDGLYFSDQSTKSLNYATNFWGGGGRTDRLFMFLVDVAMGKQHIPSYSCSRLPAGYDSCYAKAGKSGVYNNEMVVYRTSQANPTFLIEFGK